MIIVSGWKTKLGYKMCAPESPYLTTHYIGYTLEGMKRKCRHDHGLRYRHIDWIIL